MFKVKATVVGFLGDVSKYPYHFNHKVGYELIWTGGEFKGRLCPAILPMIAEKVAALYAAGSRYRPCLLLSLLVCPCNNL